MQYIMFAWIRLDLISYLVSSVVPVPESQIENHAPPPRDRDTRDSLRPTPRVECIAAQHRCFTREYQALGTTLVNANRPS